MSDWKKYRRSGLTEMRPYIPGEGLDGVSVSQDDDLSKGGFIAREIGNEANKWFVSQAFFEKAQFEIAE